MDDIDPDMIELALLINLIVSLCIVFLFILFTLPPDDSMMSIYVGIITLWCWAWPRFCAGCSIFPHGSAKE